MKSRQPSLWAGSLSALLTTLWLSGCTIFDDPSPHDIAVQITGVDGTPVQVVYSKQFEAGVDDSGGTHVLLYRADTLFQALPVDTVISVEVEKRLFVEIATPGDAQLTIAARVFVDDRRVVASSWDVLPSEPWRYLYVFNQQITPVVDVVF